MKPDEVGKMLRDEDHLPSFRNPKHRAALEREVIAAAARQTSRATQQWEKAPRNPMGRLQAGRKGSVAMSLIRNLLAARARWAVAALIVLTVVAYVMIGMNPFGSGTPGAYAAAAERLRKARTMTYKMTMASPSASALPVPMAWEFAYKEPGHTRMTTTMGSVTTYSISDRLEKKTIVVSPENKSYMEFDATESPETGPQFDPIDQIRNLPERARELPDRKAMDGHSARGFEVIEKGVRMTLWLNAESQEILCLDREITSTPGVVGRATDFRFDEDLADSLFDMTPPAGFQGSRLGMPIGQPSEEYLIAFLRTWATDREDGEFPASLSMTEIAAAARQSKVADRPDDGQPMTMAEQTQKVLPMTLGLMFVMQMDPANDWHYAGRRVKLGEADKPIAWYRPTGAETYRVIYGDLSVREAAPDVLPAAPPVEPPTTATPVAPSPEVDLIAVLRIWAEGPGNGEYPAGLAPQEMLAAMQKADAAGYHSKSEGLSPEQRKQRATEAAKTFQSGLMFVRQMQPQNDWHYMGGSVRLGEAEKPVFWYRPTGAANYRVAYGDLSVRDVAPDASAAAPALDAPAPVPTPSPASAEKWSKSKCQDNLSKIQAAKENWAIDQGRGQADVPTWDDIVGPKFYLPSIPQCPDGGTYELHAVGEKATCSIPEHNLP